MSDAVSLPTTSSAALYRATQEALRNVIAHSAATTVHVALIQQPNKIGIVVDDNGVGPTAEPPGPTPAVHGLDLLRDLANEVGGCLEVTPRPSGGTRFTFLLPTR